MARFFITGSADGLGSLVARQLVKQGHAVVLHARNAERARDAAAACPGHERVLIADLSSASETRRLADEVNALAADGKEGFEGIVHNAALYRGPAQRNEDGVPALVQVNTLAPYVLTSLITKPKKLLYISSGMHEGGDPASLRDITWQQRNDSAWSAMTGYSDSKLHMCLLSNAVARKWSSAGVQSNAMDPGWVPTKMGGASANGDIDAAVQTYVMLLLDGVNGGAATKGGLGSGKYWFNSREAKPKKEAGDVELQDRLLEVCKKATGIKLPA